MNIGDIFIGRARKYNQYSETETIASGRHCRDCIRWRLSFPYTCRDSEHGAKGKKAERCLNFSTDRNCPVD